MYHIPLKPFPVKCPLPDDYTRYINPSGAVRSHMSSLLAYVDVDKNSLTYISCDPFRERRGLDSYIFQSPCSDMYKRPAHSDRDLRGHCVCKMCRCCDFAPCHALSARHPADSCTWHGPRGSGWISGRPPGQRHGRASGRIVRHHDRHCEAHRCEWQPPAFQKE